MSSGIASRMDPSMDSRVGSSMDSSVGSSKSCRAKTLCHGSDNQWSVDKRDYEWMRVQVVQNRIALNN